MVGKGLVIAAGLILGVVLVHPAAVPLRAATYQQAPVSGIVGTWLTRYAIGPNPEAQVFSFTADGIFIAANSPIEPPAGTLTYATQGLGAWERHGEREVVATLVTVDCDSASNAVGMTTFSLTLALDAAGEHFSGRFSLVATDLAGTVQFALPDQVDLTGQRLHARGLSVTEAGANPAA